MAPARWRRCLWFGLGRCGGDWLHLSWRRGDRPCLGRRCGDWLGSGWCRSVQPTLRGHTDDGSAPRPGGLLRGHRLVPCFGVGDIAHHLTGGFVLAQAEIDRVAHPAAARPGGELDLGHQFGPHPVDGGVERIAGDHQATRWIARQRVEQVAQGSKLVVGKPGADAAGVMQAKVRVVIAEMQRAEAGAAAARRSPAEHDELFAPLAFHLQPAMVAAGAVGRVCLFADDAFQLHAAGLAAHGGRVALVVVAVAQHALPVVQALQARLAVRKAQSRKSQPSRYSRSNR